MSRIETQAWRDQNIRRANKMGLEHQEQNRPYVISPRPMQIGTRDHGGVAQSIRPDLLRPASPKARPETGQSLQVGGREGRDNEKPQLWEEEGCGAMTPAGPGSQGPVLRSI